MANVHLPIEIGASTRLVNAGRKVEEALGRILAEEKLTIPKFSILLNLAGSKRSLRLNELAEISGCSPTYAGRVIGDLSWRGLVDSLPDGTDSRATLTILLPAGEKLINRVRPRIEAFEAEILPGLLIQFAVEVASRPDTESSRRG